MSVVQGQGSGDRQESGLRIRSLLLIIVLVMARVRKDGKSSLVNSVISNLAGSGFQGPSPSMGPPGAYDAPRNPPCGLPRLGKAPYDASTFKAPYEACTCSGSGFRCSATERNANTLGEPIGKFWQVCQPRNPTPRSLKPETRHLKPRNPKPGP